MKIAIEAPQTLSLERKLKMHEAREAIIDRLARDLPATIDLERFLNIVVSEVGRMLQADRCDLLQLTDGKELKISHEWRRDKSVPSSQGTAIPIDAGKLHERFDITKPIRVNDTRTTKDPTLKFFTKALDTRSLLIIPILLNGRVLALLGLHDTGEPREWLDDALSRVAAGLVSATEVEAVRGRIAALSSLPPRPKLKWGDLFAAVQIFLLVVFSTFPVVLPFAFMQNIGAANMASRTIALAMLFLGGLALGRYAGYGSWRTGLAMVALGTMLVAAIIALGG